MKTADFSSSTAWGLYFPRNLGRNGFRETKPCSMKEHFTLSTERRFCLLVRLARPFQCQKVNSKQSPEIQRLVENSEFLLRGILWVHFNLLRAKNKQK